MKKIKTADVIRPNPPSCMRNIITVCPNNVKAVPVSTTIKPVTVTAEVAVNKVSNHEIVCVVAIGSFNNTVPITIRIKNFLQLSLMDLND